MDVIYTIRPFHHHFVPLPSTSVSKRSAPSFCASRRLVVNSLTEDLNVLWGNKPTHAWQERARQGKARLVGTGLLQVHPVSNVVSLDCPW